MNLFLKFVTNFVLLCILTFWSCGSSYSSGDYDKYLSIYEKIDKIGANVIFLRHALAPGTGDPKNFELTDCFSQRNLDTVGRKQAEELGNFFRQNEVKFDEILTSEWCRCKETAVLIRLGQWNTFLGLNSFFEGHANKKKTLSLLDQKLDLIKPGKLILMITHQVVISAVTGSFVASGEMVLYNSETGASEHFQWER